ncbi:MAG: cytochrome b N-terminal domain-containing protein [Myxococcales bacterium]|nr:cytochrome b N-terminal domain-containing protein [Myxococcales bacterium]
MKRLIDWLDDRLGVRALLGVALEEDVPGGARLQYVFGSVLVFLFMQQVLLGILLAFYYSPSATDAWASTAYLNDQVTAGWFLRGLHHHGSSAMVVVMVLHLLQVAWAGAYRKPREINWWTGLLMAFVVLGFALTGYLLPWDQKGYWATQVATGIMGTVPGGEPLQQLAQGGSQYGNLTITRFYAIHVFVLPLALGGLLAVHMIAFRKHGVTPPAHLSDEELARKNQPFWPNQLFIDVVAMMVMAVVLVGLTVYTHGAELYAPADPASNFVARPEWYFLFLFQLLKYFEGPLSIIATVIIPGAVVTGLMALPFVDRKGSRRPRARIKALAFIGLIMAGIAALTALAIVEDAGNEAYQKGLVTAEEQAEKARKLALEGVPPAGGVAVFENDPEFKARQLFTDHCAGCHTLDGHGGDNAPSFDDYGDRDWLFALLRNPRDKRFFGGTKHDGMEPLAADAVSDAQLRAVVEYVHSLQGEGTADAALVAEGKKLWEEEVVECGTCHEVKAGAESVGPTLAGRGTKEWIERIIRDSSQPDLYGDSAEMPQFKDKLRDDEIATLAALIVGRAAGDS